MLNSEDVLYENDYIGVIVENKIHCRHRHFCKQIILSETPVSFKFDGKEIMSKGMFIQSEVYHDVDYSDSKVVVVIIDETSIFAKCLQCSYLKDSDYYEIPTYIQEECAKYLRCNDLKGIKDSLYKSVVTLELASKADTEFISDERIDRVLEIIKNEDNLCLDILDEILSEVDLSKSRISHLFKECVGMSFKRYLLLKRLEKTFWELINNDISITEAAINAGFSSSSHFSYAFKQNYGISYSNLLSSK